MGKASKWLKGLLGFIKPDPSNTPPQKPYSKRWWSFAIFHWEKDRRRSQDAAVKLTTGGGGFSSDARNGAGYGWREERAAVIIQSHFRANLSRRALRGLKAVVKLQALVRGQILRKHYFEKRRQLRPVSPLYEYHSRKGEQGSFHRISSTDDKILEVDTWKPKHKHIFHSPQLSQYYQSFSISGEVLSSEADENDFTTAENNPHYYSASSMGGGSSTSMIRSPFCTPDYPSYMAYTKSSKAKVRSLSAPKQRPQTYERSSSTNRYSVHGYADSRPNVQKASTLHANFTNKVYPGSGRLDRLGMPVRGDVSGFSGGHWHRY